MGPNPAGMVNHGSARMTLASPFVRIDRVPCLDAGRSVAPTTRGKESGRLPRWVCASILVAATLTTFAPVVRCDLINMDDGVYVFDNPTVRAGPTWAGFRSAWTTFEAANWHPLTWLSLMVDRPLWGTSARGYHLTNLLLHTANTLLLFLLLGRMTKAVWRPFWVAGLFALHPLHVESVAWVAERKDVLSTCFALLTLLAYVHYAEYPRSGRYLLVVLGFACALLSKPMFVTLPCVMLLLDFWPLVRWRPGPGRLIIEKLPLVALSAASCWITIKAQQSAIVPLDVISFPARVANAALSYLAYLRQTVVPIGLAPYYPHAHDPNLSVWGVIAVSILVIVTIAALAAGRWRPYLTVGWLWYVGTLVPVIGLMQVGAQARADRYTYFPLVGIFILAVWGAAELAVRWRWQRALATVGVVALLGCAWLSRIQLGYWQDSVTLWERTLSVTTDNEFAHCNLGHALLHRQQAARAIPHFREALRLEPHYLQARFNLGVALLQTGQSHEAVAVLRQAVEQSPQDAKIHNDLGCALVQCGRGDEAIAHFREALRRDPDYAPAHDNLGLALMDQGRTEEAAGHFRRALTLDPSYVSAAFHLGLTAQLAGHWSEAADGLQQAIRLSPKNARYHRELAYVLVQLGRQEEARTAYRESLRLDPRWPARSLQSAWATATDPHTTAGDAELAVIEVEQVRQVAGQSDPRVLDTLAAALAASGRFSQAHARAQEAAAAARISGQAELAQQIETRGRLYARRVPFRRQSP